MTVLMLALPSFGYHRFDGMYDHSLQNHLPGDVWQPGPLGSFYSKSVILFFYVASFICLGATYSFSNLYLVDCPIIPVDNVMRCTRGLVMMSMTKR